MTWADEIVLLDGHSTDGTREIAKSFGAKILEKDFESFPAERQYVLQHTSHDWVLSLDADMIVPPGSRRGNCGGVLPAGIALAPNDPGGYKNLAWLFAERKTHLDEALQLAKQANELAPNRGELLDTLGWVYFQKKVYTYVGDHGG